MNTTGCVRRPPVVGTGIYRLDAEDYHADPCPAPSLNHTVARAIADHSLMHAYRLHPRLGGTVEPPNRDMILGSAVHALALGQGAELVAVPYDSYRKKEAQQLRDDVLKLKKIPILADDLERAKEMAAPAADAMSETLGLNITKCIVEHTVVVNIDGLWLRCMIDAMRPDLRAAADLKTTVNAEPRAFARMVQADYATTDVFYTNILDRIDPEYMGRRRYYFVAQERDVPDAISVHKIDEALRHIANREMARAIGLWAEAISTGEWPGYDRGVQLVGPAGWQVARMTEELGQ